MRALAVGVLSLCVLGLVGCGASESDAPAGSGALNEPGGSQSGGPDTEAEPTTLTVLAPASLTEAFTELATQYEAQYPQVSIDLSFASSTTLAQQIAEGVQADLFASAGTSALTHLPEGYARDGGQATIASNVLEIAVERGNPRGITGLQDFTRTDLDTVLCVETAPCGAAADEAFHAAGLTPTPVSREIDVKATLAKVSLGEADAALVYRSDVVTSTTVDGVTIPAEHNVSLTYPLVWFNTDPHTLGFVDLITGPDGLGVLESAGFSAP